MHVLHRFDTGGLENGVVNLINRMPPSAFRHMVVALTEVTEFRRRLTRPDVPCIALHKPPGHGWKLYPRFWQLLRQHRPAIVHTRNLAALEMQVPSWAARVPGRIHGEHGRDMNDLDGSNPRYQRIRRLYAPFVQRHVALSQDLQHYLLHKVGLHAGRVAQIYNGVDTARFRPGRPDDALPEGLPFAPGAGHFLIGTVGRMQTVKNQLLLARAFVRLLQRQPALAQTLRLVVVGDGPQRQPVAAVLAEAGLSHLAWLPGERSDVPALMRSLQAFVLPSLAEGISNTILEAMACGVPVVATRVGGNAELVSDGSTGLVVPSDDVDALARALERLAAEPGLAARMGAAARAEVERRFSLEAMVQAYQGLYERTLRA
jgi:sugar transferase (PEP-CTERM/EpsH1 system associated)